MKRMLGISVFFVLAAVLGLLPAAPGIRAQSTTDGAIGGTVYDSSGAVLPGAKIEVRNNGTNAVFLDSTDDNGFFRVTKLTPASYTVSV